MATIGDTGAPNTNTIYYDALLSTTLMAYKKTLEDNIFKDSAFLAYLKMAGGTTTQDGGERIAIPLMYGDNETVKTHGGYSVLDTTPQEGKFYALYKPSLIDLEAQAWATGRKLMQRERLSERGQQVNDSLNSGIMLN